MFVTFYLPNSYGSSIGVLNMSWSTPCEGKNRSSLTRFGAWLDLQNQFTKLLVSSCSCSWTGNDKTVGTSRSRVFANQLELSQK
jgi:hypothetical protein